MRALLIEDNGHARARASLYKIIQGDCLQVLPTLKTNSIDLLLTDPPYNIAEQGKITWVKGKAKNNTEAWGKDFNDDYSDKAYSELMLELAKQTYRILKRNGSLITFFDRGKPHNLAPFYRLLNFKNMICFIKKNPAPHLRKNNYRSGFEQAAWFSKNQYKINFISQKSMVNVFKGSSNKKTNHPTEKMEWMIKPLIERHSDRGDIVLDPFLGSGTTMKVCQELGRSCIGIESEPEYCEMSMKRVFGRTFLDRTVEYQYMEAEQDTEFTHRLRLRHGGSLLL